MNIRPLRPALYTCDGTNRRRAQGTGAYGLWNKKCVCNENTKAKEGRRSIYREDRDIYCDGTARRHSQEHGLTENSFGIIYTYSIPETTFVQYKI